MSNIESILSSAENLNNEHSPSFENHSDPINAAIKSASSILELEEKMDIIERAAGGSPAILKKIESIREMIKNPNEPNHIDKIKTSILD